MCFWNDFGRNAPHPSQDVETDSINDINSADNIDTSETAPILPNASSLPIKPIARRLYVSHFLSTWNSRIFEFGAVLYLATIFPGTLLPMSVYAVARGASAILFGSLVGQIIDRWDRLVVVRLSIVLQRTVVAASCAVFWVLARGLLSSKEWKFGLLGLLTLLACVEKLASIMNLVSVERDWVVTIVQDDREYLPGKYHLINTNTKAHLCSHEQPDEANRPYLQVTRAVCDRTYRRVLDRTRHPRQLGHKLGFGPTRVSVHRPDLSSRATAPARFDSG